LLIDFKIAVGETPTATFFCLTSAAAFSLRAIVREGSVYSSHPLQALHSMGWISVQLCFRRTLDELPNG
jgi:hypothetical protein